MRIEEIEGWIKKQKDYAKKVLEETPDKEEKEKIKVIIDTYEFVLWKIKLNSND